VKYVKYIGTKPLKRDEITGLLFAPEQVHPVDDAQCARMARHTDMYREADPPEGSGTTPAAAPGLADALAKRRAERLAEEEAVSHLAVPVNVGTMKLPDLQSYAMREFGTPIADGTPEADARTQVLQLIRGREFEVGVNKLDYAEQPSARPKPETPEQAERRSKRARKAPLVIPPDPRDEPLEYRGAQHNGPQAIPNPPIGPPGSNDLGEPVGAE